MTFPDDFLPKPFGPLQMAKRYARWLIADLKLLWFGAALLGVSVALVLWVPHEVCIRWWGLILQLVGIWTVVHDLRKRPKKGDRKGIRALALAWVQRRPRTHHLMASNAVSAAWSSEGAIALNVGANEDDPIEHRVSALEARMAKTDAALDEARQRLSDERGEREAAGRLEREARTAGLASVASRIEEVAVGTLPVSLFGVGCLGLGVFLSTTSIEVVRWVDAFR